jgi:hypothetical protein
MFHHTGFSTHARVRVEERLSMPEEDVALLLDHGLSVKISEEKNTNRVHLLFYSLDDFQCFVAVYDQLTRTVITLLPLDYYEQLNHKIAPAFIDEAKLKVSPTYDPVTDGNAQQVAASTGLVFRLSATFTLSDGNLKTKGLGTWPRHGAQSAQDLLKSSAFMESLQSRLAQAAPTDSRPLHFTIRRGNKGGATTISLEK